MSDLLRNVLAIVAGLVLGSCVNMALVTVGPKVIPPPAGVDVNDPESLRASMHLFEPHQFAVPFVAHAVGTLAGAWVAYRLAPRQRKRMAAYVIGVAFLCGGIAATVMLRPPVWYAAVDLIGAYLPMACLGIWIGARVAPGETAADADALRDRS